MLIALLIACADVDTTETDSETDWPECAPAVSYVMYVDDNCTGAAYVVDVQGGATVDVASVLTPTGTCKVDHFAMEGAIPLCP
jgi:hypothetical protein